MGVLWEACIKLVIHHLYKTMDIEILTYGEVTTYAFDPNLTLS